AFAFVVFSTAYRVFALLRANSDGPTLKVLLAIGIVFACSTPLIFTWWIGFLGQKSLNSRRRFDVSKGNETSWPDETSLEKANRFWKHEARQVVRVRERLLLQAIAYGFITSVLLMAGVWIAIRPLVRMQPLAEAPWYVPGAIAVIVATAVCFARDFGRMLVR